MVNIVNVFYIFYHFCEPFELALHERKSRSWAIYLTEMTI